MTLPNGNNSRTVILAICGVVALTVTALTILALAGKDASSLVKILLALLPSTGASLLSYSKSAKNEAAISEVKAIAVENHAATANLNKTLPETVTKVAELKTSLDASLRR